MYFQKNVNMLLKKKMLPEYSTNNIEIFPDSVIEDSYDENSNKENSNEVNFVEENLVQNAILSYS